MTMRNIAHLLNELWQAFIENWHLRAEDRRRAIKPMFMSEDWVRHEQWRDKTRVLSQ